MAIIEIILIINKIEMTAVIEFTHYYRRMQDFIQILKVHCLCFCAFLNVMQFTINTIGCSKSTNHNFYCNLVNTWHLHVMLQWFFVHWTIHQFSQFSIALYSCVLLLDTNKLSQLYLRIEQNSIENCTKLIRKISRVAEGNPFFERYFIIIMT